MTLLKPGRLHALLIQSRAPDEDTRRREFILNCLLLGTIAIVFLAMAIVLVNVVFYGMAILSRLYVLLVMFGFFAGLFVLSRFRFRRLAAYILVGFYLVTSVYLFYAWGFVLPTGWLIVSLTIIMASIVLSTQAAFGAALLISLALLMILDLQLQGVISPDLSYATDPARLDDVLGFIFVIAIMTVVTWLSNREIDHSLQRARRSESELIKQRDLLEITVEERTRELKRAQLEKVSQLYRLAEFGKLTSGLFHDLVNPLNAVSLNLERMNATQQSSSVKRAVRGIHQIEQFVRAAQKQIKHQEEPRLFLVADEIDAVIGIMRYKLKEQGLKVVLSGGKSVWLFGNPIKCIQVVTNLLSNAIDAYHPLPVAQRRPIEIIISQGHEIITITMTDYGQGIPSADLEKVFEPFFTTKGADDGTGIGLSISRNIIKKDFHGTISVTSVPGHGTTFTITMPKTRSAENPPSSTGAI